MSIPRQGGHRASRRFPGGERGAGARRRARAAGRSRGASHLPVRHQRWRLFRRGTSWAALCRRRLFSVSRWNIRIRRRAPPGTEYFPLDAREEAARRRGCSFVTDLVAAGRIAVSGSSPTRSTVKQVTSSPWRPRAKLGPGVAQARARPAGGRALRQPARVFCMFADERRPASGPHVSRGRCAMRGPLRSGSPSWPAICSRLMATGRPCRLRDGGLVQRRSVRRQYGAAAGEVRHRNGAGGVGSRTGTPRRRTARFPTPSTTLLEVAADHPGRQVFCAAYAGNPDAHWDLGISYSRGAGQLQRARGLPRIIQRRP